MAINQKVQQEKEYLIKMRRHFHEHPEVSMEEYETANTIEQELDRFGIEHHRVGETGVYGLLRGKEKGNKVILRADIDALRITDVKSCSYASKNPGVMHACGHDAHTASLLGAAKVLASQREQIRGEIGFIFQQGEEFGQGARLFLKEGLIKDAKRVFGLHVASNVMIGDVAISSGPVNASVDHVKINIYGKSAHVSTPHLGIDALYIASQVVNSLQSIVSRLSNPLETVLVGIGKLTAGSAYNIVANEAEIEGTIRCFSKDTREKTKQWIVDLVNGIATTFGAKAEVQFEDFTSPLVNDAKVCEEVKKVAQKIVGDDHLVPREQSLGGDDFAEFLFEAKGMYAYVGTGNPNLPDTLAPQHANNYDIDEQALLIATNLYVDYALYVLDMK